MHRLRRRPPRQAALALAPLAYAVALLLVAPGVGSAPSVRRALLQEPAPPSPPPLLASSPPQSPAPPPAPPICAAGTFVNETGCVACEPGSYTPEPGLLECLECPPYYFCPEYSTMTPEVCPMGSSSLPSSDECEVCAAGRGCAGDGSAPQVCPSGYAAPEGSARCNICPTRTYSRAVAATCSPCLAGYTCPTNGTKWPLKACPRGSAAPANAIECTTCQPGYYAAKPASPACEICPAGTACGSPGFSSPLVCRLGTYALEGATQCNECPLGSVCPVNDALPVACMPGTYRSNPLAFLFCIDCPPGSECPTTFEDPVPCKNGTFALARSTACVNCQVGYECPSTVSDTQIRCADGTYSVGNQRKCTVCPAGFSCPHFDRNTTLRCPLGTYSDAGQAFCTPCTPGYECSDPASSAAMRACPAGFFSGDRATQCTECPAGYYSTAVAAVSASTCRPCPAGTYSGRAGNPSSESCRRCPRGTFCPDGAQTEPTDCPAGQISTPDRNVCTMPPPPPSPPPEPPQPPSPPPPPPPRPTNAVRPRYTATLELTPQQDASAPAQPQMARLSDFDAAAQTAFREAVAAIVQVSAANVVFHPPFREGSVIVDFSVSSSPDDDGLLATSRLQDAFRDGALQVGPRFTALALDVVCQPGSYTVRDALTSVACMPCPAGTFANETGVDRCTACEPGSEAPTLGQAECDLCPIGYAAPRFGMADCRPCGEGYFSPFLGSDACAPCEGNSVANETGTGLCTECDDGYIAEENNTVCLPIAGYAPEEVPFTGNVSLTVMLSIVASLLVLCPLFVHLLRTYRFSFRYLSGDNFFDAMANANLTEEDLMGTDPRTERNDLFAVNRLMVDGRLPEANKILGRILQRAPLHADALHLTAVVHYRYGEYEDAKGFIDMALKQSQRPQFFNTMGLIMEARGEPTRALEQFEVATRRDPMFAVSFYNMGNARAAMGNTEDALEHYEKAFERDPGYFKIAFNTGTLLMSLGRMVEARRAFRDALRAIPRSEMAQFNLLCTLIRQRKLDEGQQLAELLIKNDDAFAPAYVKLGNIFLLQGLSRRAAEKYLMALERDRHHAEAQCNLGVCEFQAQRYQEAERYLRLAADSQPDFYPVHYNLAVLYLTLARNDMALESYERARELAPHEKAELHLLANDLVKVGVLQDVEEITQEEEAASKARRAHEADMEAQQRLRERATAEAKEEDEGELAAGISTNDDFFATRTLRKRPWRRLLLVSNRIKAHHVLCDASRLDVGVVPFDHERMSLDEVLRLTATKMQGFRADSIALVAPCKPGAIGTVRGNRTTLRSIRRAESIDFWAGLAGLLKPPDSTSAPTSNEFRAIHLLTCDTAGSADGQRLVASLEALVRVPIFASDDILNARRLAIDTEGARAARLYFTLTKLLQWTLLPDISRIGAGDRNVMRKMNETYFKQLPGFNQEVAGLRGVQQVAGALGAAGTPYFNSPTKAGAPLTPFSPLMSGMPGQRAHSPSSPSSRGRGRGGRFDPRAALQSAIETVQAAGNHVLERASGGQRPKDGGLAVQGLGEQMRTMGRTYMMYQRRRQMQAAKEEQERLRQQRDVPLAGGRSPGTSARGERTPKTPLSSRRRSRAEIEANVEAKLGLSRSPSEGGSRKSTARGSARDVGAEQSGSGADGDGSSVAAAAKKPSTPETGRSGDENADANRDAGAAAKPSTVEERFAGLRVKVARPAGDSPKSGDSGTPQTGTKSAVLSAKLRKTLSRFNSNTAGGALRGLGARKKVKPRYGSLTLGMDLSMAAFASRVTQDYFLSEVAAEIETRKERLRVAKVEEGLTVKVRVMDAPGDMPVELLIKRFMDKVNTGTLLIDAEFGEIIVLKHKMPPDSAMAGSPDKGSPNKAQARSILGTRVGTSDEAGGGDHHAAPEVSRVLLMSDRIGNVEQLAEAVLPNVVVVHFSYRDTRLEGLLYDIRSRLNGRLALSIGLVSHWKPGAVGFVQRLRFSLRNLDNAELRFFLSELAQSLLPGGCIDLFCVPPPNMDKRTDEVCRELQDIMHTDVNRTDALALPVPEGHLEYAAWTASMPPEAAFMVQFYYDEEKLLGWKMNTPEVFLPKGGAKGRRVAGAGGLGGFALGLGAPSMLQAARAAVTAAGGTMGLGQPLPRGGAAGPSTSTALKKVHIPRIVIPRASAAAAPYRPRVAPSKSREGEDSDEEPTDQTDLIVPPLGLPKPKQEDWTPLLAPRDLGRDNLELDSAAVGGKGDGERPPPAREEHFAEGMGAPVQHGYDMDDNLKKLTLETTGLGM